MHQDNSCSSRLCHCCALQQGRGIDSVMRFGRSHVSFLLSSCDTLPLITEHVVEYGTPTAVSVSRPLQKGTTQSGTSLTPTLPSLTDSRNFIASMYSSRQTPNTSSPLHTTPPFDYGIIIPPGASRRIRVIQMGSFVSWRVLVLRGGNGL